MSLMVLRLSSVKSGALRKRILRFEEPDLSCFSDSMGLFCGVEAGVDGSAGCPISSSIGT